MNIASPKKLFALLLVTMSLAGCVTARSDGAYWGAVASAAGAQLAPPVRPYTKAEQAKAAAELAALPHESFIANVMIPDYLRMRDQARRRD